MAYQPNPFVNPNQRGVELPAGCKDLMDVLKKGGSEKPRSQSSMVSYGVLSEVEKRVGTFLQSGTSKQLFWVGDGSRFLVILGKGAKGLVFNFFIPAGRQSAKDAVRRIFQNPEFGETLNGMEYVSVPLNPAKDTPARMLVDLLVQVFGVLEEEQLMFCSYRKG